MNNSIIGLSRRITTITLIFIFLVVAPVSAIYNFEGVPLKTVAEGQIQGDLLTFSTLGLDVPPRECRFELPDNVEWARIYSGIWGGTEKYKGWVQVTVNGQPGEKTTLYGEDDQNPNVFTSGHGVYWVANDATPLLKKGNNIVSVMTSRGELGNKLDGRIYGVVVVALVKNSKGPNTRYWIAEGNENLHGEGWSGTNPTNHLSENISFKSAPLQNINAANLTVVLLASNSGQPDYLTFNNHDLGLPVSGSANYPDGSRDIGDERSYNAGGGVGIDSRYVDMETINVVPYIRDTNTVFFEYGRDLNHDGTITTTGQKPEGEDYIHPCLAILSIITPGTSLSGPDHLVENIRVVNAYEGKNSTITATLRNQGTSPTAASEIFFRVDGKELWKNTITLDQSGIQQISVPWQTKGGSHIVEVEARVQGDTNPSNNIVSEKIIVQSPPDLGVSAGTPYRSGTSATQTQKSPLFFLIPLIGIGISVWLTRKRPPNICAIPAVMLAFCLIISPVIISPASAYEGAVSYFLPVQITNGGGSNAPAFDITLYLDGEKTVTKTVESGIAAGAVRQIDVPLYTSPGRHTVRIVIDEAGKITKKDNSTNVFEKSFDFP